MNESEVLILERTFKDLSPDELLNIDGGVSYWQAVVTGAVSGASAGAAAGTIGLNPLTIAGGAFLGAHVGVIGSSIAYVAKSLVDKKWN